MHGVKILVTLSLSHTNTTLADKSLKHLVELLLVVMKACKLSRLDTVVVAVLTLVL